MTAGLLLLMGVLAGGSSPPASPLSRHGTRATAVVGTHERAARSGLAAADMAALLERASGGWSAEGLRILRAGLAARVKDPVAAAKSFERAAQLLPGMADWALLLAADARASSGDTAGVRRLLSASEPELARRWGWHSRVTAARIAGDMAGAARAAEAALREADVGQRVEIARLLAGIRLATGDSAGARAVLRAAIAGAPLSTGALDAARVLVTLHPLPQDQLQIGRLYFRHGNAERGQAGIDAYLRANSVSEGERALLQLEAARGYSASPQWRLAEPRLRALAADTAQPGVAADALVLLGRVQIRLGRIDAAVTTLREALDRSPASARAEALFALADLQQDRGSADEAGMLYRALLADHAGTEQAAEAAMRLGGLDYVAGRYAAAAQIFDQYQSAHTGGLRFQQAGYWAGQAWLAAGDSATAAVRLAQVQRADPASFYGLRAGETLGMPLRAVLSESPATDTLDARRARGGAARVILLTQSGLGAEAALETDRVIAFFAPSRAGGYSLAEGLVAGGRITEGIRLGRQLQRAEGSWNERLLRIVYPMPYRDEIMASSRRNGVDPFLVAGLIRQESMFEPAARSHAGAVGLMQLRPLTARDLARTDGLKRFTASMLKDPSVNIRLGTRFVADLLRRHEGSLPYALAAYNAGPGRVTRWRRQPESIDAEIFTERIPFAETRDYVRTVQQNTRIYAALYPEGAGR